MEHLLFYAIAIIVIISIAVSIFKKSIKVAVIVIAALFLFKLVFISGGSEVVKDIGLNKIVNPKTEKEITSFFDDFKKKREETSPINHEGVYEVLEGGVKKAEEAIKNTDYKKLIHELVKVAESQGFSKEKAVEYAKETAAKYINQKEGSKDEIINKYRKRILLDTYKKEDLEEDLKTFDEQEKTEIIEKIFK